MGIGRNRNNLSAAQRRQIAKAAMRRKPKKKTSDLEAAKNVLRRNGKTVCDAWVIHPGDKSGSIYVDERRLSPEQVKEAAREIEERERARNEELRRQHGLS